MDKEKVIKGLEICYFPPSKCEDCPYHNLPDEQSCNDELCSDALALLKEQAQTIEDLKERLRLLDYANHYPMQSILMPAT